jgi:hypothetical protein
MKLDGPKGAIGGFVNHGKRTMTHNRVFDEVMIVNPTNPGSGARKGVRLMRFYEAPPPDAYGYFAEVPEYYGYGQEVPEAYGNFAEAEDPYGAYAEEPLDYGGYAEDVDPYGYYAEGTDEHGGYSEADEFGEWDLPAGYGDYGEDEPVSYFAEEDPYGHYAGTPVGYSYAEEDPYGYYADGEGFDDYGEDDQVAEPAEFDAYAPMGSYLREEPPRFNAGCPLPTNVAGYGESDYLDGYVRPETVNPAVTQFTDRPGAPAAEPETFKPLW